MLEIIVLEQFLIEVVRDLLDVNIVTSNQVCHLEKKCLLILKNKICLSKTDFFQRMTLYGVEITKYCKKLIYFIFLFSKKFIVFLF